MPELSSEWPPALYIGISRIKVHPLVADYDLISVLSDATIAASREAQTKLES